MSTHHFFRFWPLLGWAIGCFLFPLTCPTPFLPEADGICFIWPIESVGGISELMLFWIRCVGWSDLLWPQTLLPRHLSSQSCLHTFRITSCLHTLTRITSVSVHWLTLSLYTDSNHLCLCASTRHEIRPTLPASWCGSSNGLFCPAASFSTLFPPH